MPAPIPAAWSSLRTWSRFGTRTTYRCHTCSLPGRVRGPDHLVHPGEQVVVARGGGAAAGVPPGQPPQLRRQHHRLQRVHPAVEPEDLMLVLAGPRGRAIIRIRSATSAGRGQHRTGVAVRAEVLARVETGGGDVPRAPATGAVPAGALGLRRVLHHPAADLLGDRQQPLHRRRLPVQVHRDDRPGGRRHRRRHRIDVDQVAVVAGAVDEDRRGPGPARRPRRSR